MHNNYVHTGLITNGDSTYEEQSIVVEMIHDLFFFTDLIQSIELDDTTGEFNVLLRYRNGDTANHIYPVLGLLVKCNCEHNRHFDDDDDDDDCVHEYEKRFPSDEIVKVKTPFGTYKVCEFCANRCYPDYPREK